MASICPAARPSTRLISALMLAAVVAALGVLAPAGRGAAQVPAEDGAAPAEPGTGPRRVLLEAERFATDGGWRPIAVGQGNYMVDTIGASHVSGGRLLHADAAAVGATARADLTPPGPGRYKLELDEVDYVRITRR